MYNKYVDTQYIVVEKLCGEGWRIRDDNGENVWMIRDDGQQAYINKEGSVLSI